MTVEEEDYQLYLDEATYYLKKLGLTDKEVASRLEQTQAEIRKRNRRHDSRIRSGLIKYSDSDRTFWKDLISESEGDVKITFVRNDGFYHCRRSDLEAMDGTALMEIFDASKHFLNLDPNYHHGFLEGKSPVGFDPLALAREIKQAVMLIEQILQQRAKQESFKEPR